MAERVTVGYELIGDGPFSFRIKRYGRGFSGAKEARIIPGMDCPMWFPSAAGARGCAEDLIAKVMDQLRCIGLKVNKTTT